MFCCLSGLYVPFSWVWLDDGAKWKLNHQRNHQSYLKFILCETWELAPNFMAIHLIVVKTCHLSYWMKSHQKSVGFIIWGSWMSVQNVIAIHPIVVKIFLYGTKRWSNQQAWDAVTVSNVSKKLLASQPHNNKTACQCSTIIQEDIHYTRNRTANFPTKSVLNQLQNFHNSTPAAFHLTRLIRNDLDQTHQVNAAGGLQLENSTTQC